MVDLKAAAAYRLPVGWAMTPCQERNQSDRGFLATRQGLLVDPKGSSLRRSRELVSKMGR